VPMAVPHTQDIAAYQPRRLSDLTGPMRIAVPSFNAPHAAAGQMRCPNCVLEAGGQPASFTGTAAASRLDLEPLARLCRPLARRAVR